MKITKEQKDELAHIIDGMSQLETKMAQTGFYNPALLTKDKVVEWVNESSKLSSRLDKVWKGIK